MPSLPITDAPNLSFALLLLGYDVDTFTKTDLCARLAY